MNDSIRKPIVAGAFYPAHPDKLAKAIHDFMRDARPQLLSKPLAIVVPHAGYVFSGQICADAFNQAAQEDYDVIIMLGANHVRGGWRKNGVYQGLGFQTPLGLVEIDHTLAETIVRENADCIYDNDIHAQEHSLEVVLPFVKTLFPSAKIVPIIVGESNLKICEGLGATLARVISGKKALIVASTDLSHYPSYADALAVDGELIKATLMMSAQAVSDTSKRLLAQGHPGLSTCACGKAALLAALNAVKALGVMRMVEITARLVSYANSGDSILAERQRVVGYMAVVFGAGALADKDAPPGSKHPTRAKALASATRKVAPPGGANVGRRYDGAGSNGADNRDGAGGVGAADAGNECDTPSTKAQKQMLGLARETLSRYLGSQSLPLPRDYEPYLQKYRGIFVTLKKHGRLRGCIGEIEPSLPLSQLLGHIALQAALEDGRFRQVTFAELADIKVEISLLTPPRAAAGIDEIVLGRDGVIIKKNGKSALFLPQVASEQGWTKEVWLTELALKAGLPPDGWRSGARFYTFQAVVFGEKH